jgi:hypothetical protein
MDKKPYQVALYGLDERSYKTMLLFLAGPCKGKAEVVEPVDAQIDILDADFPTAKDLLDQCRESNPERPLIVMSLEHLRLEQTIFLQKPVDTEGMLAALKQANKILSVKQKNAADSETNRQRIAADSADDSKITEQSEATKKSAEDHEKKGEKGKQTKSRQHQAARHYSEGGFLAFLGIIPDINFDDKEQVVKASYNPKNHFQAYVKSAFSVARSKDRVVKLNSSWKPLYILPKSEEVLLEADDSQLRAFAGLSIIKGSGAGMSLSPVENIGIHAGENSDNLQNMDMFLWKLAIWTSKGRYPVSIEIQRPVYLKQWPNLTRLVVTPHALRISALLIKAPRTLMNIAEVLNIKPQYVFVFASACHALGLLGQAKRQADFLIAPEAIKTTQTSSLFRKILNKLRLTIADETEGNESI